MLETSTISPLGNYIVIGGNLFGTGGDRIQVRDAFNRKYSLGRNIIWFSESF